MKYTNTKYKKSEGKHSNVQKLMSLHFTRENRTRDQFYH